MALSTLNIKFVADTKNLLKGVAESQNALSGFTKKLQGIGRIVVGAFAVGGLTSVIRDIGQVTAEYQKYRAVLENTLQSSELAARSMDMIRGFAAKTPFQVNELTDSFVKLTNRGFKPSYDEMRKLGDIASSTGKSFNQLAEAILDAETLEFERLKEFGIKAKKEGENVTFTFKGVSTTVKATADSIRDYILSIGDAVGVSGAMAKISETLGGRISNLQDTFDEIKLNIGTALLPVFEKLTDKIKEIADKFASLSTEQIESRLKFGAVALSVAVLLPSLNSLLVILPKIAKAFKALTVAMASNPLGAVAIAVSAAVAALGITFIPKLIKTRDEIDDTVTSIDEMKSSMQGLTDEQLQNKKVGLIGVDTEESKKWIQAVNELLEERNKKTKKIIETTGQLAGVFNRLNEQIKINNELIQSAEDLNLVARLEAENAQLEIQKKRFEAIGEAMKKLTQPEKIEPKPAELLPTVAPTKELAPLGIEPMDYGSALTTAIAQWKEELPGLATEGVSTFEQLGDAVDAFSLKQERAIELSRLIGEQFASGIAQGAESFEQYGKKILSTIKEVIAGLIAKGVAAMVTNALETAALTGPAALIVAPGLATFAGGLASGLFNTLIPSFAKGAYVPKPTVAMIGDAPGGEWVLNQKQMSGIDQIEQRVSVIEGAIQKMANPLFGGVLAAMDVINNSNNINHSIKNNLSKKGMELQPVRVIGETKLRGRDIYITWHEEEKYLNRTS